MRRVHRALFVAFVDWKISATVPPIVVTKDPLEWIGDPQAHTNRVLPSGSNSHFMIAFF